MLVSEGGNKGSLAETLIEGESVSVTWRVWAEMERF